MLCVTGTFASTFFFFSCEKNKKGTSFPSRMVAGECKFVLFFPFFFFHCNLNFLSIQLKLYVPPPLPSSLFFPERRERKKEEEKTRCVVLLPPFSFFFSLVCRGLITKDQC